MEATNYCDRCNETLVLHADGSVACACDFLDSSPLGEVPEYWHMTDDLWQRVNELAPAYEPEVTA